MAMIARLFAGAVCLSVLVGSASAQGLTTFTYQGRLTDGGASANGSYDLQFSLWDSESGGAQVGSTISQSGVVVIGGVFTTTMDFGAVFPSARRFIEIAVSPAGAGDYVTLSPRQELTSVPLASSLVLPWTVSTLEASGISITAQIVGLSGTATNAFGVGINGANTSSGFSAVAVQGTSNAGIGVRGDGGSYGGRFVATKSSGTGVWGQGGSGLIAPGVQGTGQVAVRGDSGAGGISSYGVYGVSSSVGGNGVYGEATASGNSYGVWGKAPTTGYAGFFSGNVFVAGNLAKSSGSFKIDHPLDPANKYLSHSFVESPDMMNIYNGVATTDNAGYATIVMPDWFEALNRDFRYQLTVIDSANSDDFVQAKIVGEMRDGRFSIRTSRGGTKVSWQVTGIRQDAWAESHRIQVEEPKRGREAGRFIHPELFGASQERAMDAKNEMK